MSFLPLTDIEKGFLAYDRASPSNLMAAVFFGTRIPKHSLWESLNIEISREPYLNLKLVRQGDVDGWMPSEESLVELPSIPASQDNWWTFAEDILPKAFPLDHPPLLRAWWMEGDPENPGLLLCLPHLISDAKNTTAFVSRVLTNLDQKLSHPGQKDLPRSPSLLIRPSLDLFAPEMLRPPEISYRSQRDTPLVTSQAPVVHRTALPPRGGECTRFYPVELNKDETSRLLLELEARGTSLHTAVLSAGVEVLARELPYQGWIKTSTALEYRRFSRRTKVSPEDFGLWASRAVLFVHTESGREERETALSKSLFVWLRHHALSGFSSLGPGSSKSTQAPLPHLKVTTHGDLHEMGFPREFYSFKVQDFHMFTSFHRDFKNREGLAVTPSVFQGRLRLLLAYGDQTWTLKEIRKAGENLISALTSDRIEPQ